MDGFSSQPDGYKPRFGTTAANAGERIAGSVEFDYFGQKIPTNGMMSIGAAQILGAR